MSSATTYSKGCIAFVSPPVHLHPLLDPVQLHTYLPAALSAEVFTAFRPDGESDLVMTQLDILEFCESALERATERVKEFVILHTDMLDVSPLRERFPHIDTLVAVCDIDDHSAKR